MTKKVFINQYCSTSLHEIFLLICFASFSYFLLLLRPPGSISFPIFSKYISSLCCVGNRNRKILQIDIYKLINFHNLHEVQTLVKRKVY